MSNKPTNRSVHQKAKKPIVKNSSASTAKTSGASQNQRKRQAVSNTGLQEKAMEKQELSTKEVKRVNLFLKVSSCTLHILLTIVFYGLVLVGISKLSMAAYDFSFQIFGNVSAQAAPGEDIEIVIKEGDNILKLASNLEKKGVITNKYAFFIRAKLSINKKRPIIPGTYKINNSKNYENILNIVTRSEEEEEEGAS